MKYKLSGPGEFYVEANNPDEKMKNYFRQQLADAFTQELKDFIEEVSVALRKSKPGEKIHIESRPLKVDIENTVDEIVETVNQTVG